MLVKQDVRLPATRPADVPDLPVAEVLSSVPGAFRALVDAQVAVGRDDWTAAEAGFARAVALDSTFALARDALFQSRLYGGNAQAAAPALDAAMRHIYRIPERVQFLRASPFAPEANVEAARIRLATGDTAAARAHLDRAAAAWAEADPAYAPARELEALRTDLDSR